MGDYGYAEYKANETGATYVKSIKPQYTFSSLSSIKTAQKALENKITAALSELYSYNDYSDYNEYDKELWVHDYIEKTTKYNESATNCHAVYGALVEGKAVCEGYTRAFQLMLKRLGIESCTITGSSDGKNIDHIWNAVKIDGDWYQVDLTWDDKGTEDYEISYRWFNIMTETMQIDHYLMGIRNYERIPACTEVSAWYYYVNFDMTVSEEKIEDVDIDDLAWRISQQINDYGYARIFAPYNAADVGNLYMYKSGDSFELGELGNAVLAHLYIKGGSVGEGWSYGPEGAELILFMYPDEDTGSIYAADVWDMILQDDKTNDVVIRAYEDGTFDDENSIKEIASLLKKDVGDGGGQDNKCVCEASVIGLNEMEDTYDLYEPLFLFEAIPIGEYDVAIYKPGYPLIFYDLKVEEGGITRNSALKLGSWHINSFGDVDCDWNVNAADSLILKRYIAGWEDYDADKIDTTTADINGDDEIDIKDLILLEKHIAGWTGFEDLSLYWKAS